MALFLPNSSIWPLLGQIVAMVFILGIISLPAMAEDEETLANESGEGTFVGQIGVNFWINDAENKDFVDDGEIGFVFADIAYLSRNFMNFMFGADVIAVGEIWADGSYDNAFDDNEIFQKNVFLKSCYLNYIVPNIETEILAGRKEFETAESMDGDSHQGIQITTKDIPGTTLYLAIINRWVEDASVGFDLDGIQKTWLDGGDTGDKVSNTIYSIIAEIDVIEDTVQLSPYYNFQSGALANYGISFELEMNPAEDMKVGLAGIYTYYNQDTDDPMDENASSYLIYTSLSYKDFWVGGGYYEMSDDARVELTAVGNDTFDPMEEDVYGGNPDAATVYFALGYGSESYELEIMIGKTDVDATNEGGTEIDIYLTYSITENIFLDMMFVDVDDDNSELDYQVFAGGLSMRF